MTTHRLEPTPDTVTDVFDRDRPPVLTISPGDTVVVRSLDASGHLARQQSPGDHPPALIKARRGHCLTGPIAVAGARPGMVLSVRFISLRPDNWGFTVAGNKSNRLTRRLGGAGGPAPPSTCRSPCPMRSSAWATGTRPRATGRSRAPRSSAP